MKKSVIGAGVVVLGVGAAAALYSRSRGDTESAFKTVEVSRGPVVEKALAVGAIRPEREITVKSKISGIVKRTYREVGDRVEAGDPLFEILPDPTPLELTEARREVEIARNAFEDARKRHERSEALRKQGILSSQDFDQTDKQIQETQIRLNLASEKLALIEKGRVRTALLSVESVIRAPIAGTVLERLVNEGDPVVPLTSYQAGTPMATIADMSRLVFKGTVDEIDVGKLKEGMPARIKVGALPEAAVEGTVYKIAPKSKTAEGATLFDVEVHLTPGSQAVLRAGYSANADIVVREKKDVLLLPERLVTFTEGKATVELPGAPGKEPAKKDIKVGLSDGINIEVVEGLKHKDLVVERPPKKIE
ncbi:MAG TPA: efflux RND transporter periplasmic adaptor subunit [Vicinamibacteria bacterium]|nr:efflux RND transporter periplasmic adaptor subunit [Vicinamibacteria bacterium]